jgi:adenylate cyclase
LTGEAPLLVVDDDEDNRYTLTTRLNLEGYTNIATADSGSAALNLLKAKPFDLVLLDVMMPNMDGYQVLERVKSDASLRHIPVIMISAVDQMQSVIRCIELGAEDYLNKPFNPTLLRARVGASLHRKRLHDEVTSLNHSLEERVNQQYKELERLARLKRFLAPQVAEHVLSFGGDGILESHRREVTIVFCDIRGFTAFSEKTDPEDVMSVMQEYYATLGAIIHKFEGTLERFAGDGLMIIFNDPLLCPNPCERAVRMAVQMRTAVVELTRKWRRHGHELGFSIGIAHGFATLGCVGFDVRFDYTAIGPVTNRAARLCAHASAWQILIDQKVYAELEPLLEIEEVGELSLRGFQNPVLAYNVLNVLSHSGEMIDSDQRPVRQQSKAAGL